MRETHGRRGQRYLLCTNERIAAKYLPQPVLTCDVYTSIRVGEGSSLVQARMGYPRAMRLAGRQLL